MMATNQDMVRATLEFELYYSELTIAAAGTLGISSTKLLDLITAHGEDVPLEFSANDFRSMLRESFINGFLNGIDYTTEEQ